MVMTMPPLPSSRLADWQRDPDLFALAINGVEVCDERPWRVRFRGVASSKVPRLVEALQFDRLPETLGELFALLGYGGMLHESLMLVGQLSGSEREAAITQEVQLASTEYPLDHGAAMLAYLTGDAAALAECHRGNYYSTLVSSMNTAVDDAVRWFLSNADEVCPPPLH